MRNKDFNFVFTFQTFSHFSRVSTASIGHAGSIEEEALIGRVGDHEAEISTGDKGTAVVEASVGCAGSCSG